MKLEDLKVEQYVRFKDKRGNSYVRKIKEVCNEKPEKSWGAIIINKNANNVPYVSLKNIIKASFNIIDILEVGDIVIIEDFVDEACMIFKDMYYLQNEQQLFNLKNDLSRNKNKKISRILTHQQMEQISYKLGE